MSLKNCIVGLTLAVIVAAGCQRNAPLQPTPADGFYPLHAGSRWTYGVSYEGGTRGILNERVDSSDGAGGALAVVSSEYSGFDGAAPDAPRQPYHAQAYHAKDAGMRTRYTLDSGYIVRTESIGGSPALYRFEEPRFLPRDLRPGQAWSNALMPAAFLTITQHHRSFLERRAVEVPAGRFVGCIRVETEASYTGLKGLGSHQYFIDWYAPNVGLVKTLVLKRGYFGWYLARPSPVTALLSKSGLFAREVARVELLHFAASPDGDAAAQSTTATTSGPS